MWDDLGDSELKSRLLNRGVDPHTVAWLVANRDYNREARRAITEALR